MTTNKTDFFRESGHFDFLVEKALPEFAERNGSGRQFLIWSAGCSTGEEPYTMAIVLSEYALTHPGFRFRIMASDISNIVLAKAELGVYSNDVVAPVSLPLRRKYFMRCRERSSEQVRVVPELRRLVEFRRLNFMDADYGIDEKADAIFCRNVIIYFDRPTQERILRKLANCLAPGGYLFVGHCRDPARYGSSADAGGAGALQEDRWPRLRKDCRRSVRAAGRIAPGQEAGDPATLLGSCVGITFWIPAPGLGCALPSHAAQLSGKTACGF